jgi:putative ABC transport system substrate-binding protein
VAARGTSAAADAAVGFLNQEASELSANNVTGFRKGLSETGFVENQNVTIEYRWAEGR